VALVGQTFPGWSQAAVAVAALPTWALIIVQIVMLSDFCLVTVVPRVPAEAVLTVVPVEKLVVAVGAMPERHLEAAAESLSYLPTRLWHRATPL
jgi:hypothetical protein